MSCDCAAALLWMHWIKSSIFGLQIERVKLESANSGRAMSACWPFVPPSPSAVAGFHNPLNLMIFENKRPKARLARKAHYLFPSKLSPLFRGEHAPFLPSPSQEIGDHAYLCEEYCSRDDDDTSGAFVRDGRREETARGIGGVHKAQHHSFLSL